MVALVPPDGMNVLITGASSGIGAALARRMAADGATVGIVGRREERLREVRDDCHREGSVASRMWVADLADLDRAEQIAIEAWDAFGHLDVLVNNAAMPKRRRISELTPDEVTETMTVNFMAPVRIRLVNPGPIDTEIWDLPDNEPAVCDGPKVPPEEVAEGIVAALDSDRFEHYLPDLESVVAYKTSNIDEWIRLNAQI